MAESEEYFPTPAFGCGPTPTPAFHFDTTPTPNPAFSCGPTPTPANIYIQNGS